MNHLTPNHATEVPNTPGTSQWHTIRPWTSRLSLSVREITSVSATFSLTSGMDNPESPVDLAGLGLDEHDFYDGPPISDLLGRELDVKVNSTVWQNVLVHMDDDGEEATIVLYGLMPGRHYEVELNVVSGKEPIAIRKHVVTDADSMDGSPTSEHAPEFPEISNGETSPALSGSLPLPPVPSQLPAPPRSITVEERAAQLRHNLSLLNTEKESLLVQLKNTRKEAQRAEASLRSEMDVLKRASEKQAATEHRTRQKVLALQESVKQALNAASEAEEQVGLVETSIPSLEEESECLSKEHASVSEDTKRREGEAEEAIAANRKRVAEGQSELSTLTHRLDRLNGKKDRFEKETIPDLETELTAVQAEYAELEKEHAADVERYGPLDEGSGLPASVPHPSQSLQSNGLAPIGRPTVLPVDSVSRPQPGSPSRLHPGILHVPHRTTTR